MGGMRDTLGDEPFVPNYPETPGFTNETTSREAAERIEPRAGTLRAKCLDQFRYALDHGNRGLTADEVATAVGESVLAIRPRISELSANGWICGTGITRKNESGVSAVVWRLSPGER